MRFERRLVTESSSMPAPMIASHRPDSSKTPSEERRLRARTVWPQVHPWTVARARQAKEARRDAPQWVPDCTRGAGRRNPSPLPRSRSCLQTRRRSAAAAPSLGNHRRRRGHNTSHNSTARNENFRRPDCCANARCRRREIHRPETPEIHSVRMSVVPDMSHKNCSIRHSTRRDCKASHKRANTASGNLDCREPDSSGRMAHYNWAGMEPDNRAHTVHSTREPNMCSHAPDCSVLDNCTKGPELHTREARPARSNSARHNSGNSRVYWGCHNRVCNRCSHQTDSLLQPTN